MTLIISGIMDGPLPGGLPKVIELTALADVADLSAWSIESANNGAPAAGAEFTLSGAVAAGETIYIATETTAFQAWFGFAPDFLSAAANINGDDAILLYEGGTVVDAFGAVGTDGSGEAWDYLDGWAYRADGALPGATFDAAEWTFSGIDALDGATSNATADPAFPAGSYDAAPASGPVFSIAALDAVKAEGDAGPTSFTFTVTRGGDVAGPATVDWAVAGDADAADFGGALPAGTVAFADGQTEAVVAVSVAGDVANEGDEAFSVTLSNVSSGSIATASAQGTIRNDDLALTLISEVQGNDATWIEQFGRTDATPFFGATIMVSAIVVGDFQDRDGDGSANLGGFFLQEEDADADGDATTSEGIFVFEGGLSTGWTDVQVGDRVTVIGTASEFFGETQIRATSVTVESSGNALPSAATITFPIAGTTVNPDGQIIADLEAYEGMLVAIEQEMTVADVFDYARFGELGLYADGRLETFTQGNMPDAEAFAAYVDLAVRNTVTLNDGLTRQNPDPLPYPDGAFDAGDDLTSGDTVSDILGVVRYSRSSGGSGDENYRINPIEAPTFENTNPREATPPEVGGDLKVASFNVLNYFNGDGTGGGFPTSRGADSYAEFLRQQTKIVEAIVAIDADVLGLIEIENDGYGETSAIASLTDAINAALGAPVYGYVDPGTGSLGSDAIAVGFIYKTGSVALVGDAAVLDKTVDARFDTDSMRPSLAQTFLDLSSGETFTTVVNHLKSKGSPATDDPLDQDQGDGAGASNFTRTRAAEALVDWIASDPTGSGDGDVLLIGDLNAYAMEDPIRTLLAGADGTAGTADDLVLLSTDYSYGFPVDLGTAGQVQSFGTLDYAIATQSLAAQSTGTATWHINADEPPLIDYNTEFKPNNPELYAPDPYRSSDHDPVIVGFDFNDAPLAEDDRFAVDEEETLTGSVALNDGDADGDALLFTLLDGPDAGEFAFNADGTFTYVADADLFDLAAPGTVIDQTFTYAVSDGEKAATATGTISVAILDEGVEIAQGNGKGDLTGSDGGEDRLFGENGGDAIRGLDGADYLSGGRGPDLLLGGEGADFFFFARGSGKDRIEDFELGLDTILLAGDLRADSFADIRIRDGAGGAVLDFGGAQVVLAGVDATLLTADDFQFV